MQTKSPGSIFLGPERAKVVEPGLAFVFKLFDIG
jgi:hypothetical protein